MAKSTPKIKKKSRAKKQEWTLEDFIQDLSLTMETQAQEHPALRQVHARLEPKWKEVEATALRLIISDSQAEVTKLTEELVATGEMATRVVIELLRSLRKKSEEA